MFNNRLISTNIQDNETYNKFLEDLKFDYSQMYRGIVVDNNDPLNLGRVKVRIPQLHGSEENKDSAIYLQTFAIPWATSAVMVGAGNNTGSYLIPNIGDIVFVTFEGGKAQYPIYFGGILTKYKDKSSYIGTNDANLGQLYDVESDDFNTDITNKAQRVIYKSLKGATIIIDDSDGNESIKIIDQLGQSISLENTSGKTLQRDRDRTATDNMNFKSGRIMIKNSNGTAITLTDDEILLKAPKVRIEANDYRIISSYNADWDLDPENKLADNILGNRINLLDITKGYENAYIDESGNIIPRSLSVLFNQIIYVEPDTDYYMSINSNFQHANEFGIVVCFYTESDTLLYRYGINIYDYDGETVHTPNNIKYVRIFMNLSNITSVITDDIINDLAPAFNLGTSRCIIDEPTVNNTVSKLHNKLDELLDYREEDVDE